MNKEIMQKIEEVAKKCTTIEELFTEIDIILNDYETNIIAGIDIKINDDLRKAEDLAFMN